MKRFFLSKGSFLVCGFFAIEVPSGIALRQFEKKPLKIYLLSEGKFPGGRVDGKATVLTRVAGTDFGLPSF